MRLRIANCELRIKNETNSKSKIQDPKSIRHLVHIFEDQLRDTGAVSARAEAEWLVAESLGVSRNELYLRSEPVDLHVVESMHALLARRLQGEPLQYVLGCAVFLGHRLRVSPAVLVPRPETEVLTDHAIRYLARVARERPSPLVVLDVGTGSGNIAISLAKAIPTCVVMAVELSWEALQVAQANAVTHQLADRIRFIQADWTSGVRGPAVLVMSNPPYVPTRELDERPPQDHGEPRISLDGGGDGMAFHRRLIADMPGLLAQGGAACFECAEAQAEPLACLVSEQPWVKGVQVVEDLAGRPRGLWIQTR